MKFIKYTLATLMLLSLIVCLGMLKDIHALRTLEVPEHIEAHKALMLGSGATLSVITLFMLGFTFHVINTFQKEDQDSLARN